MIGAQVTNFTALVGVTSSPKPTREGWARLLADAEFLSDWEINIERRVTGAVVTVSRLRPPARGEYALRRRPAFRVLCYADSPIECYDVGRRHGTRMSLKEAQRRFTRGWWN